MKHYPLSSSQLDFWFDQILHPDVPLYNIGGYARIDGPINLTLFKQAFRSVIAANDALQIILHESEGLPTQTFSKGAPWEMDFRDFSEEIDTHQAALTGMQQKFSEPFSLYGRLLFRVALCKVADNCYYWLNTYHHIINDGWGISLVVQQVSATYNALVSGQTIATPSYSYRDVIQDDKNYLNSRRYIKDKGYWRDKYRELPKPMLTSSYADSFQVRAIPSRRATLCLPWDFYHRLTEFAETHQTSTLHVILGTFYCYFTRINRRNDLAVGLPTLNRNKAILKQTVGSFSGISPAWFCLGTSGNFIWLIEAIGKELRADYRHQHLPMIQIIREVSTHRDQKLFDFTLSYARHNYDVHFDGAPSRSSFLANGFYPQDHGLFITIEEFHRQEDVNIHFDYNSGFFEEDEIQCLIARFEFLLEEILRQPDIPIRELPIIPDSERNRRLEFHHNGFACHSIEEGIVYVKSIHDVTHISDIVFDERQDASVCLIRTKSGISIELVAGNQVRSLLNRGSRLYHVCYEVPDLFSAMEWLITKGASVISDPKPALLFDNRPVAFLDTPLGLVELLEKGQPDALKGIWKAGQQPNSVPYKTMAIAATFTAEPLKEALDFWMTELDLPFKAKFAPYSQVFQQLLDPESIFVRNQEGINVVLVRLQDWGEAEDRLIFREKIECNAQDFAEALKSTARHGTYMVCLCPSSPETETEHGDFYRKTADWLVSELEDTSNVYLTRPEDWMKTYSVTQFNDPYGEKISHIPYTSVFFTALGTTIVRRIHATLRSPYKVIVLDCDDTLWQGVSAEDKVTGIVINTPHLALQRFMIDRQRAGKLLCLCSKNREQDVLAIFDQRSDMLLQREHLVSWRINWNPKSENIHSLAEELNLGLSSFIFIDDSPVECAEVLSHCPEVTTLQLPADPNRWEQFLNHVWAFDNGKITTEDRQRTDYYRQDRQRSHWRKDTPTFRDFLAGLELEVRISPMTGTQLERVAQLTQRTNQFNVTTIRRTEADIRQLCESGVLECLTVMVKDRFGDYGLVGVMLFEVVTEIIRVDTFLLSCRALGRGVEHRMLARLGEIAGEHGLSAIEIPYLPSDKNQPALDFLESVGGRFKRTSTEGWEFHLPTELISGLTYAPVESAPDSSYSDRTAPGKEAPTGESADSMLFQRIAIGLHDAGKILARIKEQGKKADVTRKDGEEYVAPRTPEEESLAGIWADVLGIDQVGIHDDFFHLGGHSILGTQLMSRICDTFAIELPLHTLFELPSIAQLSARLRASTHKSSLPPITPIDRTASLPLSFTQQRLWFLDRLEGKSPAYNIVEAVHLDGKLDQQVLEKSLQFLVQRHESLRTIFPTVDGIPVVRLIDDSWEMAVSDLQALAPAKQEQAMQRLLKEEALHVFDLATGPLFRARLFLLGEMDHILQVNLHHIITDGWSLGVFVREWRIAYEAILKGQFPSLPPLMVQYADFAHWQRQWLTGKLLDEQIAYWKERLADAPVLLELPTDHPRPPVQSYRGASLSFLLPAELTDRLKQLAQETGATLFMTLLSSFAVLLFRYSGQDDIVVGSPIAGRAHGQTESLMGPFVNTLALRLDLARNPTFEAVLEQTRSVSLQAHAHQDIPFEYLVKALQPVRNLRHAPIFQVMFALQNAPLPDLELPGLTLSLLELPSVTAKFDLTLEFRETDAGLMGYLEYATDLFERPTMDRLVGHLQTLLAGIVGDPKTPICELPLLTETERQQLLAWNDTAVDYPAGKTIVDLFESQVEKTPEAVAVVFRDRQLTYRELNRQANRLAHYLRELGVGPEVLVGIYLERSPEIVIGLLGILKAGGAYVPLDPDYPAARLAFMLEDTQVPVLLTRSDLKEKLPETQTQVICLDAEAETLSRLSSENPKSGTTSDNLAYVIYTSGSTGKPKGILVTHLGLTNYLSWSLEYYQVAQSLGAPVHSTLGFDATITSLFLPLLVGRRIVLLSATHEADAILTAIQDFQHWSFVKLTPAHLEILNTLIPKQDLSGKTRFLILGGEELFFPSLSLWRSNAPETRIINEYGPTETVVGCCIYEVDAGTPGEGTVPIGRPISNTQLYILDNFLQRLPIGVPGELHISGAGVARGYLNRPELTAEKFIENPFSDDPNSRLYKTGDLARYLPDGNIEYLGRMDNQVKIRGFRIELGEIESALMEYPDVQEAVVIVREDKLGKKRLVGYIVSNLLATRIPYQTDCLVEYEDQLVTLQTADICVAGVLLKGKLSIEKGKEVRVQIRLPGGDEMYWLNGRVVYSQESTISIDLKLTPEEQILMGKGITCELEDKGFSSFRLYSLRNKLRHALNQKLPSYMVPSDFVLLMSLPLTPNGKIDRHTLSRLSMNYQFSKETFVAPRTPGEKLLAGIWSHVLGIERVGIHDDFFELGGHSLLAVNLLARIEQRFGKHLPLSVLFQGPTVADLALRLDALADTTEDTTDPWRPLVAIRVGGTGTPFFCLPGAGGNVLYLHELARHLGKDQPFYGLQAVGLDGETEPDASIQDMAEGYILEIQTVQPHGPYLLGGHSSGGWVALEMCKQLRLAGQEVARLAIFDTTVPFGQPIGVDWNETDWIIDIAHIAEYLLGTELGISDTEFRQSESETQLGRLHELLLQNGWPISLKQLTVLVQIFKSNCQMDYVPQDIPPIPISLFKAKELTTASRSGEQMSVFSQPFKDDPAWGWEQYAIGPVDIHEIPGNHYTIMTKPNVEVLAEKLRFCLDLRQNET